MILCGLFGAILIVIGAVLGWGQYLMIYVLIIVRQSNSYKTDNAIIPSRFDITSHVPPSSNFNVTNDLCAGRLISFNLQNTYLQNIPLIDGTINYKAWSSPMNVLFSCYLFNVTNPDDVMRGEKPNFVEIGPFTYDVLFEKQIIDVDEEADEITYMEKWTYTFNKQKSTNVSRSDKVTILNPAYIGTILTLATLPAQIMQKYGDNIPKLFTNRSSIFLKARPVDILFNGVKVACNLNKFPELNLICKTLAAKPPPVLRATEKEGVYFLSIFQRMNATLTGPFSTNRGLKNITRLGDTTSFKGKRVQTFWSSESCNKVRGTDTITWAPLVEPLSSVSTFIPELCRTIDADYELDLSINGLIGSRYAMKERVWFLNETECYCAVVQKKKECLPQGLIDVAECQEAPIIMSEPHFLHGDPELLSYARGLKPDEKRHSTFVVIEPVTGAPLSGRKKIQLNLRLSRQPVELLSNVSEGFFPLMWCEKGNTPTLSVIKPTYQYVRLIRLLSFVQYLPLIIGIYMVLLAVFLRCSARNKLQPTISMSELILVSPNLQINNAARRAPRQPVHTFERFQRATTVL